MRTFAAVFFLGALGPCGGGKGPGGGGSSDSGADGGDDGTDPGDDGGQDDTAAPEIMGSVSGTVTVELYRPGLDGERDALDWTDSLSYDADSGTVAWPFGNVFVAAYTNDEFGNQQYVGSTTVSPPSPGGDPYSLDWRMPADAGEVYIYAALDRYGDTVVSSDDPRGVYPLALTLADGDSITGIDLTILTTEITSSGGGCGSTVTIDGSVLITVNYGGGSAATMLVSTAGQGPYHVATTSPTPSALGAEGSYSLSSCAGYGPMKLVGAWDRNQDGLFAPDDTWGAYAPVADTDGNPVQVGATDLSGYDVQIPLGDSPGVNVVPFVMLSGEVSMASGSSFDSLPAGSSVYVAALKYRPTTTFDIRSAAVYDIHEVDWADLTGTSASSYSLVVPADTVTYLWAFADEDVDGFVNESGEHIASFSTSGNGRLMTGAVNQPGLDLRLGSFTP